MSTVIVSKQQGVATLTLNRARSFNSVNAEMRRALLDALDDCAADPSVKCVLLTGAGRGFCAGQDLEEIFDAPTAPSFESILDEGFNLIVLKIRQLQKPVVAAINGVAAGAGANLALVCDVVVAAESALFIQAFSKIGLIPDSGGTFTLPRLIGFARASALMMLGDKVSAAEAQQMGMIYKYFPDDVFEEKAKAIAATLAEMPTRGFALTKQALNAAFTNDFEAQLALETKLQGEAASTDDYTEGVSAFLQKRKPTFLGR